MIKMKTKTTKVVDCISVSVVYGVLECPEALADL